MCPYCFPIPVCLKVVPGFFSPQQKQNSAEKNCSKTGSLDLRWSKQLLRSLSLEFIFFFLRDLVLFKGQSPKICLQRFSPGLSVSHSHLCKGQRQLPAFLLLCSPLLEHLIHREISCPGLEGSCHLFWNGKGRERRGNWVCHLHSVILNGAELARVLQPSGSVSSPGWEAKPFAPWVEGIGLPTTSLKEYHFWIINFSWLLLWKWSSMPCWKVNVAR